MTEEAKQKQKFRKSAKWKKFRNYLKKRQDGLDLITMKKLYKGYTVHHLDLDAKNYENLDEDLHFLACNKKTHEAIHWLYDYYKNDPQIIKRLEKVLNMMIKINEK